MSKDKQVFKEEVVKHFRNSERGHNIYDSDPRVPDHDKYTDEWKHTHEWFPFKSATLIINNKPSEVTVWCDCGYGHYAIQINNKITKVSGEDIVDDEENGLLFLGDYYGEPRLFHQVPTK